MKRAITYFISFTDSHFTSKRPMIRKDDFERTQINKFRFLCAEAQKSELKLLVSAGDLFDSVRNTSYELMTELLKSLDHFDVKLMVIAGQHDMRFHDSSLSNTPLKLMDTYNQIILLDGYHSYQKEAVRFFGYPWGVLCEDPNVLYPEDDDFFNIFLMHRPVFIKKPGFWDHEFMITCDELRKSNPVAELFITGDNHEEFIDTKGVAIVNSGNLCRTSIDQIDRNPKYVEYFWDQEGEKLTPIFKKLPIEKDVFNDYAISDTKFLQKAIKTELDEFTSELKKEFNPSNSFKENVILSAKGINKDLVYSLFEE